jgi:hypothetical protein
LITVNSRFTCALPKYDQSIKSVSYNVIENNR